VGVPSEGRSDSERDPGRGGKAIRGPEFLDGKMGNETIRGPLHIEDGDANGARNKVTPSSASLIADGVNQWECFLHRTGRQNLCELLNAKWPHRTRDIGGAGVRKLSLHFVDPLSNSDSMFRLSCLGKVPKKQKKYGYLRVRSRRKHVQQAVHPSELWPCKRRQSKR